MRNTSAPFGAREFAVLSERQLDQIHLATLEVLRRTGIRFYHEDALEMLRRAGAYISDGNVVRFPARLVEAAIASAPCRVVMCNRDGAPAMFLEDRRVYFGTGSDCPNMIDPDTGERRPWTTEDLVNGYRVCDALPNIHFVMSLGIPMDVPEDLAYRWQYAHMFQYTSKPIVFVCNDRTDCADIVEMASIVAGGREALKEKPFILLYSEPISPLKQSETAMDKLLFMAEQALPVVHSPAPMMGATAPITIAGGLVMANAEILSALTVHQLTKEGAPFVYGAGVHHMDMRSMQICHNAPEFELAKAGIAQLGQYYGLPTWGYAGNTDAKVVDEQAAAEAMFSVLLARLNGANLVHDVGYLESGLTTSLEMIVLADELIAMTERFVKGIEVTDETLSVDVLHKVGSQGNFLTEPQTLEHFRTFWFPGLLDRYTYTDWQARSGLTLGQKLKVRVQELIERHRPELLSAGVVEGVMAVIERARSGTGAQDLFRM